MSDRLVFILLYRLAPSILNAVTIVRPETIVRWHRAGFHSFWRWKSRRHAGRPSVAPEIRRLIREMSLANPLWGAPLSLSQIPSAWREGPNRVMNARCGTCST
jgi:hypothetical protein